MFGGEDIHLHKIIREVNLLATKIDLSFRAANQS